MRDLMYDIDGKQYVSANPNKRLVRNYKAENVMLLKGDTITVTYKQKDGDKPEEVKYENALTVESSAVVTFDVKTYDDKSYDLHHSVDYVRRG